MSLPTPLTDLIKSCEKPCVKECCGIEAFDFSPVHVASWLHSYQSEPTDSIVSLLNQQLDDVRASYGSDSDSDGYESDEDEMNQIFSPAQVDQLVNQLKTNLQHAVELNQQSNLIEWKPEGFPSTDRHRPELGNAFVRALSWRYATKKFDPRKSLLNEDVEIILKATNLSASSYGLQPYQYILIQDKSIQEALVPVSYGQPQVLDAAAVLVFAIRTDIDEDYIRQCAKETEEIRAFEPGTLDAYAKQMIGSIMGMDDQQRALWATRQCYISMGTALAACAMLGIDACPMEGIIPDRYDEILGLAEKNLHAVLALPIGYRASDDVNGGYAKVRKPLDEIVVRMS